MDIGQKVRAVSVHLMVVLLFGRVQLSAGNSDLKDSTHEDACSKTWFFWNNVSQTCECGPSLGNVYQCNQDTGKVWLNVDLLTCITYDNTTATTTRGNCPYKDLNKHSWKSDHVLLPMNASDLTEAMCGGVNREGLLCSQCKPGYGPAVLSYDHRCVPCSGSHLGWLLYLCFAVIPTTLFFVFLVLCQVRTTSAPLNLFVFGCQWVSVFLQANIHSLYWSRETKIVFSVFGTFFTMWNLDFFPLIIPRPCISEKLSNLQVLACEYMLAFYPLFLIIIVHISIQQHTKGCKLILVAWKPFAYCLSPLFKRYNWNPTSSIIHIFASFLILSSMKILYVSVSLLQTVNYANITADGVDIWITYVLYYDPSIKVFDSTHLPYAVLAITTTMVFVIVPCMVLILYPTKAFQKFLNFCGISCPAIHAFADAFNGCYKNGTNGTRDCRSFAGFYLFLRVVYMLMYPLACLKFHLYHEVITITFILILFIFAVISPYKSKVQNILDSFGLMLFALHYGSPNFKAITSMMGLLYLMTYFVLYIICKFSLKLNCRCSRKLRRLADRMNGRNQSQHTDTIESELECTLPDRMVNPDVYRALEQHPVQQLPNDIVTVPDYGSI